MVDVVEGESREGKRVRSMSGALAVVKPEGVVGGVIAHGFTVVGCGVDALLLLPLLSLWQLLLLIAKAAVVVVVVVVVVMVVVIDHQLVVVR